MKVLKGVHRNPMNSALFVMVFWFAEAPPRYFSPPPRNENAKKNGERRKTEKIDIKCGAREKARKL